MNYHISSTMGDDANPGTKKKPWRTLARANAEYYDSGDEILLRYDETFPGNLILTEQNYLPESGGTLSVGAYSNERTSYQSKLPVIEAGDGNGITIRNIAGVTVENIAVVGSGYRTNAGWGIFVVSDLPTKERLSGVTIQRVRVSGFRWAGIYVGGVPNDLPGFVAPDDCRFGFAHITVSHCATYDNAYYKDAV